MKNNKGFTLIEILGAIIIIGIISIIAFNTFTSSLRGFREDYYTEISRTLEKSGQEFFNDNRNYRPGQILGAQKVSISTLASKSYVDEVVDYNGDKCENTSYVLIVKEARDEYSYHTCLVCSEDSYDNTKDEYCDSAWLDSTKISYGIGDVPTIYIYKGTPRDEVKDKLELSISYQRLNSKGEVIRSVRGTGEDKLQTILPVDIDIVDTNKIGTYKVHYEYKPVKNGVQDETIERKEGKVIVYENDAPNLNITYKDVVAKQGTTLANVRNGSTEEVTGNYASGEWHQEITINLSSAAIKEPNVTPSRYQWKKADGRWVDFCTTNNNCTVILSSDMNETVEFRMIDTNGKISKVTNPIIIRRDKTKPTCTIVDEGTKGDDDWYRSDVDIRFTVNEDVNSTYEGAMSGVKINNLDMSTTAINRNQDRKTNKHTTDTTGVTYIGYVEDNANNFNTCAVTFKRDVTPPVCELQTAGTIGDNNWFVSDVTVSFKKVEDATSDVRRYGIGSDTGVHSLTHTEDIATKTYTGHIRDKAGNTSTCNITFKKDSTKPVCGTWSGESQAWTSSNRTISVACSDEMSQCVQNPYSTTISSGTTSTRSITFTLKDNAGNTETCTKTANVYVDKDKPTCGTWSGESTNWTAADRTITMACVDTGGSGCVGTYSNTTNSGTVSTKQISFTIQDAVGNTETCSKTADVYVDKDAPTCGTWSGESKVWTSSDRTVSVGCSDTGSGCVQSTYSNTTNSGTTSTKSISFTIKDNVGHTATCSKTADVYVDKDNPECGSWSGESTAWTANNRTISVGCTDTGGSGCTQTSYSDTTSSGTVKTKNISLTIKDNVGHTVVCTKNNADVYVDKNKPTCGDWSGESTTWTADDRTISVACSDTGSGCKKDSYSKSYTSGTTKTDTITLTIKDKVGNERECKKKDADVYVDQNRPTCTIEKDSDTVGTTGGVTVNMTCSDTGSGCKTETSQKTGRKEDYTFTVKDNVGHENTCTVRISSELQKRTKSCDKGKRCSDADCEEYKKCSTSHCGTHDCNCSTNYYQQSSSSCSSGTTVSSNYNGDGMYTVKCKKCSKCNNECRNSHCGCETRERDISACGCDDWGSYDDWAASSSCTEGESSNHHTYTECRTVYK
jgi:prepilin-type N-terminal cleavage/methylation domain-containing protein